MVASCSYHADVRQRGAAANPTYKRVLSTLTVLPRGDVEHMSWSFTTYASTGRKAGILQYSIRIQYATDRTAVKIHEPPQSA